MTEIKEFSLQIIPSITINVIIIDRFYFVGLPANPPASADSEYICFDKMLVFLKIDLFFKKVYERFFSDWGPLHIGQIYHYIQIIQGKLSDPGLKKKKIIHYCDLHPHHYTNSSLLCMCYQYLIQHKSIEEIYTPFFSLPPLSNFRDASFATTTFPLMVIDCLKALDKAIKCYIFNFEKFDIDNFELHERIKNGDLKWIIPSKILAFSGPFNVRRQLLDGSYSWCPEDYAMYFNSVNITDVVRLNEPMYDRNKFLRYGIKHHELQYPDGGLPTDKIIFEFLQIVDNSKGGVAVHCKAGLGRTGSLIGCYLMKKYHFTATEAIAWMRLCRPGCVLGIQQQWLVSVQNKMWNLPILNDKKRLASASASGVNNQLFYKPGSKMQQQQLQLQRQQQQQLQQQQQQQYTNTVKTNLRSFTTPPPNGGNKVRSNTSTGFASPPPPSSSDNSSNNTATLSPLSLSTTNVINSKTRSHNTTKTRSPSPPSSAYTAASSSTINSKGLLQSSPPTIANTPNTPNTANTVPKRSGSSASGQQPLFVSTNKIVTSVPRQIYYKKNQTVTNTKDRGTTPTITKVPISRAISAYSKARENVIPHTKHKYYGS